MCNLLAILFIAFSATHFSGAPILSHALTEEQRLEVEKVRAELNEAFEKHEEEEVAAEGVVVQPKWLQNSAETKTKIKVKVEVTKENIQEVQAMRSEINQAVVEDVYVGSAAGNTMHIKQLEQELKSKGSSKETPVEALLAATHDADNFNEMLGASKNFDAPNIVDASAFIEPDIDVRKLQSLELSQRRTREMLVLKSITEDYSFALGDDVQQWAVMKQNSEEYFVGKRFKDLLIVRKTANNSYEESGVLQLDAAITLLQTYSHWNAEQQRQEGIIMLSTGENLLWYRGNNQTDEISLYWQWNTGARINALRYFNHDSQTYMAICINDISSQSQALNLYQFQLNKREFWLTQRLQLPTACREINFLNTGRDLLLALPLNNTAHIYIAAAAEEYLHFELQHRIESEQISSIAAFQMGARSYLALGGLQPQILLYQQGQLVPKTILGNNFGLVELFFPVPTRTYRDDLLLLIQHRVDFGTHTLTVLETLNWNGDAFVASVPAPCHLGAYTTYGVSCMLDMQRDAGLKGATTLRRAEETLILVPRHKATSGLFQLRTELLAKNSELLDLQQIFEFLKIWVKEQQELIAQAQTFLQMPTEMNDAAQLQLLLTPELVLQDEVQVDEIFINDYKWTAEDSEMELDDILQRIEKLGAEVYDGKAATAAAERAKREIAEDEEEEQIYLDTLELEDLQVQQLILQRLNDEPFYVQNGQLEFNGILHFKQGVQVLEHVAEELNVLGNLQFEKINNENWQKLINNMVMRNKPGQITQLKVDGQVIIENELTVQVLNSLNFPQDFLWSSGPSTSIVKAPKRFTGTLTANAVDTDGLINGVSPLNAITLSDAQDWPGMPTFAQLKVTEKLELKGTTRARGFEDFPKNPTLTQSNIVNADCDFEQLEVLGAIVINKNFIAQQLPELLKKLLPQPIDAAEEILINSAKSFNSLTLPMDFQLQNNAINNVPVEQFVNTHTKQELSLDVINGFVYFHNLSITGLYDGIQLEQLIKNAIKIDEPLEPSSIIGTQLNFANIVLADEVQILSSLNSMPIAEAYQTVLEDLNLQRAHFEVIMAKQADVQSNIYGSQQVLFNGLNLTTYFNQNISNIYVQELQLQQQLEAKQIYGIDSTYLLNFLNQIDDLPEMILDGNIQVDHIVVLGDVQVNKLNAQNFDEDLQLQVIWLNRPNYLSSRLHFLETVYLHGNLNVEGAYNSLDLPHMLENIVFRSYDNLNILAPKRFLQNMQVLGNTQTNYINELPVQFMANHGNFAQFNGSLTLHGNLYVQQLHVAKQLNNFKMSRLTDMLRYQTEIQNFILQGTTHITTQLTLYDLKVLGNLNEFEQLSQFLQNLVYKHSSFRLTGNNSFIGRVSIAKGASIEYLDDYNLAELFNNMIFIDSTEEIIINSTMRFKDAVTTEQLISTGNISTSNFCDCNLQLWLNDTLRLDKPLHISRSLTFAAQSLNSNAFNVQLLNGIELNKVITLYSAQNLSGDSLLFSTVYLEHEIITRGLVNQLNLPMAYANTLLTYGNQQVSTRLLLPSITVLRKLFINGTVNEDLNFNELATLHELNLQLNSPLYFQNIITRQTLAQDLISGVNFDDWQQQALWLRDQTEQRITGNWSVQSLTLQHGPMVPSFLLQQQTHIKRDARASETNQTDCDELLQEVRSKQNSAKGFVLKHLQFYKDLNMPSEDMPANRISKTFILQAGKQHYLLVNRGCQTLLYQWPWHDKLHVQKPLQFEMGLIAQLEMLQLQNKQLILLTNDAGKKQINCSYSGLNSWTLHLDTAELKHLKTFQQTPIAIQLRTEKGLLSGAKLFVLNKKLVQQIKLTPTLATSNETILKTWNISAHISNQTQNYQFLDNTNESSDIMLINDEKILLLSDKTRSKRLTTVKEPLLPLLAVTPTHNMKIKPSLKDTQRFTLADFKQVLEHMLLDLSQQLSIEINITQLSIPETDLYDEHLIPDFLAIMQQLQQQSMLPTDMFSSFNAQQIQMPANPAQVLAARSVQAMWSTLTEIEEVHKHLRATDTEQHPVCACINQNLGSAIRDVLQLANNDQYQSDYMTALTAVIERIRQLQTDLKLLLQELHAADPIPTIKPLKIETSQLLSTSNFVNSQRMEVLTLQVGSCLKPRKLIAACAAPNTAIQIYLNLLNSTIYQIINTQQPTRSLAVLRIASETLLAYVEGCCKVHIRLYRGVQGFLPYHSFNTEQNIVQLLSLTLPSSASIEATKLQLLAVVFDQKISFYRFVTAGHAECS